MDCLITLRYQNFYVTILWCNSVMIRSLTFFIFMDMAIREKNLSIINNNNSICRKNVNENITAALAMII